METKRILYLFLLFAVVSIEVLPTQAQAEVGDPYTFIFTELLGLFKSGDFQFLGHRCEHRRRPKVKRFKLKWEGKVWCPGFAPITGRATTSSRSGSIEGATRDYARQVVQLGLATKEELKNWLH